MRGRTRCISQCRKNKSLASPDAAVAFAFNSLLILQLGHSIVYCAHVASIVCSSAQNLETCHFCSRLSYCPPWLPTWLACASKNLQQVSRYLHALVHSVSFPTPPRCTFSPPILPLSLLVVISYGIFMPGRGLLAGELPPVPSELVADFLSTCSPT